MRVVHLLIILLIIGFAACDSQMSVKNPSKSYFLKYFGGDGSQQAVAMMVNTDGTFYILGNSRAASDSLQKIYIAQADATGNVIWQQTFNEHVETEASGFVLTSDQKKLIVVANKYPSVGISIATVYVFDAAHAANPIIIPVTDPANANIKINSITLTQNQEYLLSGKAFSPSSDTTVWVYLMDPGTKTLDSRWPGATVHTSGHNGNAVKSYDGNDGNYYMYGIARAGFQGNYGKHYYSYAIPASSGGGGTGSASDYFSPFYNYGSYDLLTDVVVTDFASVITGITDTLGNNYFKLLKMRSVALSYNPGLDLEAQFSVKGIGYQNSSSIPLGKIPGTSAASLYVTGCASGQAGYYFLANTFSSATNSDILLLKTNILLTPTAGYPLTFGGAGDDTAAAVAELPDGHIMVLGTFQLGNPVYQYKIVLMKLNAQGKLQE